MPSCNTTPSTLLKCNENLKRLLIVSASVLPSRPNQCDEWSQKTNKKQQTNKIKTRLLHVSLFLLGLPVEWKLHTLLRTFSPLPSKLRRARLWHKRSLEAVQGQPLSAPADEDQTEMDSKGDGKTHSLEYTHPRSVPPIPSVGFCTRLSQCQGPSIP